MNRRELLMDRAQSAYRDAFGAEPTRLVAAPGRVNLIGEHCDYNDGLVLPCAIDRETVIAIGESSSAEISTVAADFGFDRDAFGIDQTITPAGEDWKNHVRGVAHMLRQRGIELRPAQIAISGDVPIGAGLSSSASLGVAAALALTVHSNAALTATELALVAQRSENDFVGCACGIMDQLASAASTAGSATLIDCRTLDYRAVPIADSLAIVIIDSGVRRTLTESPFNTRRAECEAAARHYGVAALRDLRRADLDENRQNLDETLFRRARHIVTEIERVRQAEAAIAAADLPALAQLMQDAHRSLRDDFEVSIPQIDRLVDMVADTIGDRGGVRMTGAGFGGCVVAVTDANVAPEVIARVETGYNTAPDANARAAVYAAASGAGSIG